MLFKFSKAEQSMLSHVVFGPFAFSHTPFTKTAADLLEDTEPTSVNIPPCLLCFYWVTITQCHTFLQTFASVDDDVAISSSII